MWKRLFRWLPDTCPDCGEALLAEVSGWTVVRRCPHGHYRIERHPVLGIEVEILPHRRS